MPSRGLLAGSTGEQEVVTTGRSLAEGQATRGTSLSDLASPAADSGLPWRDLENGLAVLHYQQLLQSHMINDGLFPHFCF